eukprot:Gregarina_sp_Poly_1__8649@NODE_514_length_7814_cov_141_108300_g408_i0_p1_GENE_NODE_514_length_7814_cov_141_108300_g408_i0NODE_514_length_7814_cov_141_108300_g408_i0_p1_ORF_typecomplete_len966_score128_33REJ/PF02010_15/79REJ/PF02010_15/1_2e09Reprolysin_4/PF13583_6/0_00053Peptidase_M10/PF00413_24/0_14_NODE_514_length_7814_cov_141_108300_g408_i028305727
MKLLWTLLSSSALMRGSWADVQRVVRLINYEEIKTIVHLARLEESFIEIIPNRSTFSAVVDIDAVAGMQILSHEATDKYDVIAGKLKRKFEPESLPSPTASDSGSSWEVFGTLFTRSFHTKSNATGGELIPRYDDAVADVSLVVRQSDQFVQVQVSLGKETYVLYGKPTAGREVFMSHQRSADAYTSDYTVRDSRRELITPVDLSQRAYVDFDSKGRRMVDVFCAFSSGALAFLIDGPDPEAWCRLQLSAASVTLWNSGVRNVHFRVIAAVPSARHFSLEGYAAEETWALVRASTGADVVIHFIEPGEESPHSFSALGGSVITNRINENNMLAHQLGHLAMLTHNEDTGSYRNGYTSVSTGQSTVMLRGDINAFSSPQLQVGEEFYGNTETAHNARGFAESVDFLSGALPSLHPALVEGFAGVQTLIVKHLDFLEESSNLQSTELSGELITFRLPPHISMFAVCITALEAQPYVFMKGYIRRLFHGSETPSNETQLERDMNAQVYSRQDFEVETLRDYVASAIYRSASAGLYQLLVSPESRQTNTTARVFIYGYEVAPEIPVTEEATDNEQTRPSPPPVPSPLPGGKPLAKLAIEPFGLTEERPVWACGSHSYDPDGNTGSLSYDFLVGDNFVSVEEYGYHGSPVVRLRLNEAPLRHSNLTMTVQNYIGRTAVVTEPVRVGQGARGPLQSEPHNVPPVIRMQVPAEDLTPDQPLFFCAVGSFDPDGDTEILDYSWSVEGELAETGLVALEVYEENAPAAAISLLSSPRYSGDVTIKVIASDGEMTSEATHTLRVVGLSEPPDPETVPTPVLTSQVSWVAPGSVVYLCGIESQNPVGSGSNMSFAWDIPNPVVGISLEPLSDHAPAARIRVDPQLNVGQERTVNVRLKAHNGYAMGTAMTEIAVLSAAPTAPSPWSPLAVYPSPCISVLFENAVWLNGWYTTGEPPGPESLVWREKGAGNMHAHCL